MQEFWVIDTKCKVSQNSPMPQDGSKYYFGRSVVPAASKSEAIEMLSQYLKHDCIYIEETLGAIRYEDGNWSNDDYDVKDSFDDAQASNEIELGCFISEKSKSKKEA